MTIPLSRPPVDDEIKGAALAAIESRHYILGPECKAFEAEFARYIGTRHAVLTSSGTAALWMTLKALGAKAGDEVLVPAHTAFPTVEAICFSEATPVFVDVDDTYAMDPADAAQKITSRTVGIIPVHIYGHPVNLTRVQELVSRHGLWLIEDCCQAHGATWQGKKVGSFGRAGAFSFYPSKNLTVMGDGGILVTDDDEIAARCRRLRDHGRLNKDVHSEVGFNLRFNDIQAAIGRVILGRLDAMNERRRQLAARYEKAVDFDTAGSITILAATTMPGDDITHPVPDNTGYITEGQFYLKGGVIEPFGSLSRLKQQVNGKTRDDHRTIMDTMIQLFANYRETLEKRSMGFQMSAWDKKLLKYGALFESQMMSLDVDVQLEEALDRGWRIMRECLTPEETGIKKSLIEKYWPK